MDVSLQFAGTGLASLALLVMTYIEVSTKVLRGLKGKKTWSMQMRTAFSQQAATTAVFHVNAVYVVSVTEMPICVMLG